MRERETSKVFPPLRLFSYLVLLLMLLAAGYTTAISFVHWSGIAV